MDDALAQERVGVAAVTGHRPKTLFGYDLTEYRYTNIRLLIRKVLVDENIKELWTGMALGTDMLAAMAVIDLQNTGHDIKLNAAIPFHGHKSPRWPESTQKLYDAILSRSARVEYVTDGGYSVAALDARNRYMVDRSTMLIAVYNGTPGGTANCIRYARKKGVPIMTINPDALS